MEVTFHPTCAEAVTKTGGDAGYNRPAGSALLKIHFIPNENPYSGDAECDADELGCGEAFLEPDRSDEGTEDGDAGVEK